MKNSQWETNVKQHIPALRRYARALTGNTISAEDLVQDCLERAWDKRSSWSQGSNFRAWVYSIMHNIFINNVRREKLHQQYINRSTITTSAVHEENHMLHDLEICLSQLKPEFKEVILLAGLENLSYKEIADITSTPIGTVMSRLSRGRSELRILMAENQKPKLVSIK